MKTKLPVLLTLFFVPAVSGSSIDYSPNSWHTSHWDLYVHRYNPASGWSSSLVTGNAEGQSPFYTVYSDGLAEGDPVSLLFNFQIALSYGPGHRDYVADGLDDDGGRANFAGFNVAEVSVPILGETWSATFPPNENTVLWKTFNITVPVQGVVGENWVSIGNISHHVTFTPDSLSVFDPALRAGFQVEVAASVSLVSIQFEGERSVADGGATFGLLGLGLAGIAYANRKVRVNASRELMK